MTLPPSFKPSPWDKAAFGMEAYEISEPTRDSLELATRVRGHYTLRLDPLASKQLLHEYGFYYCDTLIEPYCTPERFFGFSNPDAGISREVAIEPLLAICRDAFVHGRFHRDFNLPRAMAEQRYARWLRQLHGAGNVYGLLYRGEVAGFIGVDGNRLVLHAMGEALRGRGLAKFLWTPVCRALFEQGCSELLSSVSAANLAVVNLYANLGFRFRGPVDVYHRLTP